MKIQVYIIAMLLSVQSVVCAAESEALFFEGYSQDATTSTGAHEEPQRIEGGEDNAQPLASTDDVVQGTIEQGNYGDDVLVLGAPLQKRPAFHMGSPVMRGLGTNPLSADGVEHAFEPTRTESGHLLESMTSSSTGTPLSGGGVGKNEFLSAPMSAD